MVGLALILAGCGTMAVSGLPAYGIRSRSAGQIVSVILLVFGGVLGAAGLGLCLADGSAPSFAVPWPLPVGRFSVALDPVTELFLGPVFVVPALGALFSLGYWPAREHTENTRRLGLAYGLLAGAMGLVLVSRDGVLFLMAWEIMALAAFFAATAENHKPEVAEAGWVYLVATHIGTLVLFAMFALWARETGSFALEAHGTLPSTAATAIFALAVIGFGFKAGLMPFHVWLPGAHAHAPSHVSAVMSGIMLKMGIYGIVRMTGLLPVTSDGWGLTLLAVGALTGLGGVLFALGQTDLKRVLAYSSIENLGVITMALGLALLGRYYGRLDWITLGLGAALLHVVNHGLFKPLLFLGAGSVLHGAGTRHIDQMGGLGQRMPQLMVLFLVGAVSLGGLPPLNGFVSEWLLYLGFFHAVSAPAPALLSVAAALAAAVLALVAALVLSAFVRLFGAVFLGLPRKETLAAEPDLFQRIPMALLAAGCVALGFFPAVILPWLDRAVRAWYPASGAASALSDLAPTGWLSVAAVVLVVLGLLAAWLLPRAPRRATWDCGYAEPTSRMEYTGTSFGQSLVSLFAVVLRPRTQGPNRGSWHRDPAHFRQAVPDFVLERLVMPVFRAIGRQVPRFRFLQQGQTQVYILYVFGALILLLGVAEWGGGHG